MPSMFQGYTGQKPKPPVTPPPAPDPTLTQQALEQRRRSGLNNTVLAGDLTRGTGIGPAGAPNPARTAPGVTGIGGGKSLLGS